MGLCFLFGISASAFQTHVSFGPRQSEQHDQSHQPIGGARQEHGANCCVLATGGSVLSCGHNKASWQFRAARYSDRADDLQSGPAPYTIRGTIPSLVSACCRYSILCLRPCCRLPVQAGLCSSQFMVSNDQLSPLFTPDQVQEPTLFRDRKNAHDLTDTSGRLSHAYKLTNREHRLHHAPNQNWNCQHRSDSNESKLLARSSMG
jgi:hypothetical protein